MVLWDIKYTREMPADEKTLSPNTQAIPPVPSMTGITPISIWVIGWVDQMIQIRLNLKGMSFSLTVRVRLAGHQLLEKKPYAEEGFAKVC